MDNDFLKKGLTTVEAQKKLSEFGPNTLPIKKEVSLIRIFLAQFESPLVYILVLAGWVTLFLREWTDSIVIFSAVLVNTILGFYQEKKAQKALSALRHFLVPQAKVIRDKEAKMVPTTQIVPGDLVILTLGTRIPADGILVEATDFSVNEAILTGEAMPVPKKVRGEEKENVFMGTMVVTGIAKMKVTQTGTRTKMGQIGQSLVEIKEEKTPLQENLTHLSKILAVIFGFVTIFIFALGALRGYPLVEIFVISVAVAVAAIPEGLMVTLTVILALGMQRILARKALVRKLISAETLGSVSVICADKTGTLTQGQLKVVQSDFTNLRLGAEAAVLCNDMRDPLEIAMMNWVGEELGEQEVGKINEKYPRLSEIPFSFKEKYIVTLHPGLLLISGAPEVILKMSNLSPKEKKTWLDKFEKAGRQGLRLVGFASKEVKPDKKKIEKEDLGGFKFLGVLIYEDPVRIGVKEALDEAKKAGISLKVITGDHTSTAKAVLGSLGVSVSDSQIIEGEELDILSETQLKEKVSEVLLFTRTNPQQKLKIVKALKDNGEVVAMMGDGVNDAPALKMADIGLVVGDASDVAKETADIILLDSQFTTIVHAIEEGRTIFENIKKVILFLLSHSFAEIILIGGCLLLGLPLALTAVQILWINLIEDSLPAVALAFESKEKEVMFDPPRPRLAPILNRPLKMLTLFIVIFTSLVLFAVFLIMFSRTLSLEYIQTVMFVALGINSLFYIFACRTFRRPIFQKKLAENKFLIFSVIFGLFLLVAAVYFPPLQIILKTKSLGLAPWLFVFGLGILNLIAIEAAKWFFLSRGRQFLSQR